MQEQASKALLYYPEESHIPNEAACNDFNARVMKHLMKSKMQKNDTFYVSKVLKGNNNFLRRDTAQGANRGMVPLRKSAAAVYSNNNKGMSPKEMNRR